MRSKTVNVGIGKEVLQNQSITSALLRLSPSQQCCYRSNGTLEATNMG